MGDPKKPRFQRAAVVERVELSVRLEERFLNDIFALRHRPRHSGAVSMQARPKSADRFQEREVSRVELAAVVKIVGVIHTDSTHPTAGGIRMNGAAGVEHQPRDCGIQGRVSASAIPRSTIGAMTRYPASFGCTPSLVSSARSPCRSSDIGVWKSTYTAPTRAAYALIHALSSTIFGAGSSPRF